MIALLFSEANSNSFRPAELIRTPIFMSAELIMIIINSKGKNRHVLVNYVKICEFGSAFVVFGVFLHKYFFYIYSLWIQNLRPN